MTRIAASVVIPFLDPPAEFFRAAIRSVLGQSRGDWELILVDDGSAADVRRLADEHAIGDERVRVVEAPAPRPSGISAARNAGITVARGEFVAMLDADDVYESDRLLRHVEALRAEPAAAMAVGDSLYWRSWQPGADETDRVPALAVEPGLVPPPALVVAALEGRGAVPCVCSFTVRRSILSKTGGFEPAFRSTYEDQVFLAKIASSHPVLYVNETLERYRIHPGSLTAGASRPGNPAERRRFLDWLELHAVRRAAAASRRPLLAALRRARWELRHPLLAGLRRRFRKWGRRLGEGP